MSTAVRAALSVLVLAGFYVLTIGLVGGFGLLTWFAVDRGRLGPAVELGALTVASAVGVVIALVKVARAARAQSDGEPGVVVAPAHAPELWAVVHELARLAQTRVPDEIRLVPDVNAAVSEDTRFLGLKAGRRRLYLGVPLMQGLNAAQLRSVLAHELGHYSHAHTRLAPVAYRGRQAVIATVAQLGDNIIGKVLLAYAKLYLTVSAAVSRSQELEADRLSVLAAGRGVAQSALRELPVLDAAWSLYMAQYVQLGLRTGYAPTDEAFYAGFGQLLAGRAEELARLRQDPPPADQSRWDSHPPVGARIAAMDRLPDAFTPTDPRPSTALVPGFGQAAAAVVQTTVSFSGDPQRLDWGPLIAQSVGTHTERIAEWFWPIVARVGRQPSADVALLMELLEAGWAAELAREAEPEESPEEAMESLRYYVRTVLQVAAVRQGLGRWQGSWAGPAMVVASDGTPLDLKQVTELAFTPHGIAAAKQWLAAVGLLTAPALR